MADDNCDNSNEMNNININISYEYENKSFTVSATEVVHNKIQSDADFAQSYFEKLIKNLESGSEKFIWNHRNTLFFLDLCKTSNEKFRNPKIKKRDVWNEISTKMCENGYFVTGEMLDRKMRNMKITYKSIKDNKKSTGRGRIAWEYFDIFEDLFRNDLSFNPKYTISSLPTISEDTETTNPSDPQIFTPEPCVPQLNQERQAEENNARRNKYKKATQLTNFRKRLLQIEEAKLEEIKKIRIATEKSNEINEKKLKLLELALKLKEKN